MKVKEVMTTGVVTVSPGTRLEEVAAIMTQHTIRAVPVVDEAGTPVGLVSDRELFVKERNIWLRTILPELFGQYVNLHQLPEHYKAGCALRAGDVMTRAIPSIDAESDLGELIKLMTSQELSRVVVLSCGLLAGIVTRGDIVRRMLRAS
jgi:CBS domain-containing protein